MATRIGIGDWDINWRGAETDKEVRKAMFDAIDEGAKDLTDGTKRRLSAHGHKDTGELIKQLEVRKTKRSPFSSPSASMVSKRKVRAKGGTFMSLIALFEWGTAHRPADPHVYPTLDNEVIPNLRRRLEGLFR